jgi:hypothetical protein
MAENVAGVGVGVPFEVVADGVSAHDVTGDRRQPVPSDTPPVNSVLGRWDENCLLSGRINLGAEANRG